MLFLKMVWNYFILLARYFCKLHETTESLNADLLQCDALHFSLSDKYFNGSVLFSKSQTVVL